MSTLDPWWGKHAVATRMRLCCCCCCCLISWCQSRVGGRGSPISGATFTKCDIKTSQMSRIKEIIFLLLIATSESGPGQARGFVDPSLKFWACGCCCWDSLSLCCVILSSGALGCLICSSFSTPRPPVTPWPSRRMWAFHGQKKSSLTFLENFWWSFQFGRFLFCCCLDSISRAHSGMLKPFWGWRWRQDWSEAITSSAQTEGIKNGRFAPVLSHPHDLVLVTGLPVLEVSHPPRPHASESANWTAVLVHIHQQVALGGVNRARSRKKPTVKGSSTGKVRAGSDFYSFAISIKGFCRINYRLLVLLRSFLLTSVLFFFSFRFCRKLSIGFLLDRLSRILNKGIKSWKE